MIAWSRVRKWLWNIGIALDQLANAVLGGDPDETISSRAAKSAREGRLWGCIFCRLIDRFDPNHCEKTIEPDEGKNQVWRR